ncbi:transposase [Candidatus Uhrbacteria bacterium]|nr:transposase [Candidatus Uhrbacteria bacterium]
MLGAKVPPAMTKEVFEELLETEAFQVNSQPLMDASSAFLVLDGVWQSVKSQRTGETRKRVTLVALGMDEHGENQRIFGFRLAFEEDETSWTEFLRSLEKRGVNLQATKLVIADGGGGLLTALERLAPSVPVQTCLSHRYRNTLKHTPHKLKGEMGKDLHKLTEAQSKEAFLGQVKAMEQRWATLAPNAVTSLLHHVDLSTTYLDFPREVWVKIRTTNILDRAFREVRARTHVHFDHYQNPDSSNRYHQAILGDLNQRYFKAA